MTISRGNALEMEPTESWAQKVAKGLKAKVPTPMMQKDIMGDRIDLQPVVIYEDVHLKDHLRIFKSEQIIQQTLEDNSVIFEIPKKEFATFSEMYRVIEKQIGKIDGVIALNKFGTNLRGNIFIEVTFMDNDHNSKAIQEGIIFKEVNYKASPSKLTKSDTAPKMVRVHLSYVPKKQAALVEGIFESMRRYGKICEIKKMLYDGFFEGQVSVLLDINDDDNEVKYQPLQRMLYMEYWDRYLPASFKGAPPVCYQCRQSGHIRKHCPMMKQLTCSRCLEKGHTARFCKMKEADFQKELCQYEKVKENQSTTKNNVEKKKTDKQEKVDDAKLANVMVLDKKEKSEDGLNKDSSSKNKTKSFDKLTPSEDTTTSENILTKMDWVINDEDDDQDNDQGIFGGSLASKYAPITSRTTMDVDQKPKLDEDQHMSKNTNDTLVMKLSEMNKGKNSSTLSTSLTNRTIGYSPSGRKSRLASTGTDSSKDQLQ